MKVRQRGLALIASGALLASVLSVGIATPAFALDAKTSDPASFTSACNSATITLDGDHFRTGTFSASDFTFAGTSYSKFASGTFDRTADDVVTITGISGLSGSNNTVTVKADSMSTQATSVVFECAKVDVQDTNFEISPSDNAIVVTLTGGTFATGIPTAGNFSSSAGSLAGFTFVRTSATVVTITGITPGAIDGVDLTFTVKAAAMTNGAASVSADGTKADLIYGGATPTLVQFNSETNCVTITLADGNFDASLVSSDFGFTGSAASILSAGKFTRADKDGKCGSASGTDEATISNISGLKDKSAYVTVRASAMEVGSTSITSVTKSKEAVTSLEFSLSGATNVAITLNGGSFKAGTINASDFTFDGASASVLAAGSFDKINDNLVIISGLTGLTGDDNVVTVKAATMLAGAASVSGSSSFTDVSDSTGFASTTSQNGATITLTGATFKDRAFTAADFEFSGPDAAAFEAGSYTRTSSTVITILTSAALSGSATKNTVTVLGAGLLTRTNSATAAFRGSSVGIKSPAFTLTLAHNAITVNLTSGSFKSSISSSSFLISGTGAPTSFSVTRESDTAATLSGFSNLSGSYTVTVSPSSMTTVAAAVSGSGTTIAVTSGDAALLAGSVSVTITLAGGSFKSSIAASDFTFAGTSASALAAGTFLRTASNVVTISGLSGLSGTNNSVTVPAATMVNGASAVTLVGGAIPITAVTSPTFFLLPSYNSVTITLAGGTFKAAPITAADFTFAGSDAAAFLTATFTRTSPTVVTVTGLSGVSGVNNTVTVKAATIATLATGVLAVGGTQSVTSAPFTLVPSNNALTITLVGGVFKETITASDFEFAGPNALALAAGGFSRTSDTVVTINGLSGLSGLGNTVSIKPATMFLAGTGVTAANVAIAAPTGRAGGLTKATTAQRRIALKPIVSTVLNVVPGRAPVVTTTLGKVVAPRVTGLTVGTIYTVSVRLGGTSVSLGRVVPTTILTGLPAMKMAKKGTYYIQVADPVGKQFYLKITVK